MAALIRSPEPVRLLDATALGLAEPAPPAKGHASNQPDDPELGSRDPRYLEVLGLLDRFGGVIFTGPPGTSKTYFAHQIAEKLAGGKERVTFVQFHPSYQYEDFMQGFVPKKDGTGFKMVDKSFVEVCQAADKDREHRHVLVIDELSRGDPGRVFGEALTYVDRTKRELEFRLASGDMCFVPANVVVLATMNPYDRGVDEVDAAFERRFAKIAMEPDPELLQQLLERNGLEPAVRQRLMTFFRMVNGRAEANPQGTVGHTYFTNVDDAASLRMVWDYQLRFLIEKAYRLDRGTGSEIKAAWATVVAAAEEADQEAEGESPAPEPSAPPE